MRRGPYRAATITTMLLLIAGTSCGGGGDGGTSLSEAGERGKRTAAAQGCSGCHGASGQGGAGPTWQGLAGSEVLLLDGTTTIADDEYLRRSIVDPGADLLADYDLQMPNNRLSDDDVADVIAYIKDLGIKDLGIEDVGAPQG